MLLPRWSHRPLHSHSNWTLILCVLVLSVGLAAAADATTAALTSAPKLAEQKGANVMLYEPELPLHLSEVIHPYAWEHRRPDPYFSPTHNAYSIGKPTELANFLEVQTHVKAHSQAATKLTATATVGEGIHGRGSFMDDLFAPDLEVNKKGFSKKLGFKPTDNPASVKVKALSEVPSDFLPNPDEVPGAHVGNRYRRAAYGLRRRRMPYYATTGIFGSINPFHRPNGFMGTPSDMFSAKPTNPLLAIRDPRAFDFGRSYSSVKHTPYGGFSSFAGLGGGGGGGGGATGGAYGGGGPFATPGDGLSGYMQGAVRQGVNDAYAYGAPRFGASTMPGGGGGGFFGAVPNFIPGMAKYFDFYGGADGGAGGSSGGSGESSGSG